MTSVANLPASSSTASTSSAPSAPFCASVGCEPRTVLEREGDVGDRGAVCHDMILVLRHAASTCRTDGEGTTHDCRAFSDVDRRSRIGRRSGGAGAGLPEPSGDRRGSDRARWRHGDGRAPSRSPAGAAVGQAVRHREPAGRRHQHRRRRGRPFCAGRPHPADGNVVHHGDQRHDLQNPAVRPAEGSRAGRALRARAVCAGCQSVIARADRRRSGEVREGKARHAELRQFGHRHGVASVRRTCSRCRPASTSRTCRTRAWRSR